MLNVLMRDKYPTRCRHIRESFLKIASKAAFAGEKSYISDANDQRVSKSLRSHREDMSSHKTST